jgi:putative ATPase
MKKTDEPTLFSLSTQQSPLPQRRRPRKFSDIAGQAHFLNDRFQRLIASGRWTGLIFWGPPGTGKTSLAYAIASETRRPFHSLSAVASGVKEIRDVIEKSVTDFNCGHLAHVLFIDELHRLNRAQQDVLLPYLEAGSIRFIGATTENPSFEVNNAVASRCLIFGFKPLSESDLCRVLRGACTDDPNPPAEEVLRKIASCSLGDARRALNILEHLRLCVEDKKVVGMEDFEKLAHAQALYYDKRSEAHYDTISAFIKSVRGSDPDAALYYLARMLEGGEDPLFIARRLIILSSEDIGNAQPRGLVVATAAFQACHAIGMPEARIVLAQATTFLACSPKSNRSYLGINAAMDTVRETGNLEIPMAIRNAPTTAMKTWGYGKGYVYPHDTDEGWAPFEYLPEVVASKKFYEPTERGCEKEFGETLKKRKARIVRN